jgi:hypothetical protein
MLSQKKTRPSLQGGGGLALRASEWGERRPESARARSLAFEGKDAVPGLGSRFLTKIRSLL